MRFHGTASLTNFPPLGHREFQLGLFQSQACAGAEGIPTEYIDPGLVHHLDLQAVKNHRWENPVRIAVLHHPLSHLPQTEIAAFAGTLNAGQVKATLIEKGFCLAVHGHLHAGWFGSESWPEHKNGWVLHIAAAPTLGSSATGENNDYNEIEIAREGTDRYYVTVRRIIYDGHTWTKSGTPLGPFEPGKAATSPVENAGV